MLDLDSYLVGFRGEYPKTGFGITRLIPVCQRLSLLTFSSADISNDGRDWHHAPIDSVSQMPPRSIDNQKPSIHPENLDEESSYDEEIWSKLPAWAKILADLKRKARKAPSN
jgi:hypothetical protein